MFETSLELLRFHWVAYTIYSLMIISIIAWFGFNLTRKEKVKSIVRIPFYGYMAFLVIAGVGHHIFTYNAIPWVEEDIKRHHIEPDKVFKIEVKRHKWKLPEEMRINMNEKVVFDAISHDLTYGFGLFRKDGSMVFQMQVFPKHKNTLLWTFKECGEFDIRSTEYAGPAQYDPKTGKDLMFVESGVIVNCVDKFVMRSHNGK